MVSADASVDDIDMHAFARGIAREVRVIQREVDLIDAVKPPELIVDVSN